ncbi:hypothetical protein WA026_002581 [Henosepilachna vigintioctopunctata]|uniref:Autophagy-related protein n=1 Tax=Henosepilachna vigintioctopunctata TaxID=420089 RepID=A0AAW1U4E6_9CUCU
MYSISQQKVFICSCPNNNEYTFTNSEKYFKTSKMDFNSNRNDAKKREIEKEEILAIRTRFPTKVPVIVRKFPKEKNLPELDKTKYLVPQEISMSQFQTIIRNRMHLLPTQAIYLLINEKSILSLSLTMAEVYKEYALPDGYLYVTYASQDTFGFDHTANVRNVIN